MNESPEGRRSELEQLLPGPQWQPVRERILNLMAADRAAGLIDPAALERLLASEERLRLIIENAREFAIFTLDLDRRITSWTRGAELVLGFSEDEVAGESGDIIFTPEDRARGVPREEAATAFRDGRASDERWHLRKGGERLWGSGYMMRMRSGDGAVIGFVKMLHDRTDKKLAEEARNREKARETAEAARTEVLLKLVGAQEDERRRISRELHDEIGQHLTALVLGLNELAGRSRDPADLHRLRQLQAIAESVGREVHHVASRLRPTSLDDLGLVRSLSAYVRMWAERSGVKADFHAAGFENQWVPAPIETAVYRIVQEALNNVLKHARARTVAVILEYKGREVRALIEDDGRGFDVDATMGGPTQRLGLLGMVERAGLLEGEMRIESLPGHGTTVIARFPILTPGTVDHG